MSHVAGALFMQATGTEFVHVRTRVPGCRCRISSRVT
jgi:hypothetical protein